jgi:hypothetical protein
VAARELAGVVEIAPDAKELASGRLKGASAGSYAGG